MTRYLIILLLILQSLLHLSCDGEGYINDPKVEFNRSVKTEVKLGLHIVPVTIRGKEYHFLFDTGAPTSISRELQKEFRFRVVDKGQIVDSDKNRIRVSYVKVDSIKVAKVRFSNVKAFVADFRGNPTLACLELDGIIGSNMMQACNWQIDYVNEKIDLSNAPFLTDDPNTYVADFRQNKQFDILVNLKMGRTRVSNMKLDYGNNSAISVPHKVFKVLVDEVILKTSYRENGFNQGGLGSKPVAINRYYGYLDSLQIGDLISTDLTIKTGASGLIGYDFLSRYIVAINWSEKKLRFKVQDSWVDRRKTFGYNIGLNGNGEPVLFGVIENSVAAKSQLQQGMRVLKVDTIDFTTGGSYCDYINYRDTDKNTINIEVVDANGRAIKANLVKTLLGFEK